MPRLLTTDGRPLTWAALHAANDAWRARRRDGYGDTIEQPRPRACGQCRAGTHTRCSGRMMRDPAAVHGSRVQRDLIACPCTHAGTDSCAECDGSQ